MNAAPVQEFEFEHLQYDLPQDFRPNHTFPFDRENLALLLDGRNLNRRWNLLFYFILDSYRLTFIVYRYMLFSMIESFYCKDTEALFSGKRVKRFANIESIAQRKLQQLDSAVTLNFLRSPPGNRLEALSFDRTGQHSIRINDQFRLCFVWNDGKPKDVEIIDYH